MFFYAVFRPDSDVTRPTLGLFFGAALFGALYVGALVAAPPLATLAPFAAPERNIAWRLLASLGGAALVQELGKAAVVVLVVRALGAGSDGRHGLFAGLIVGAGFGLTLSVAQVPVLPAAEEASLKGAASPSTALYAWFLGTWVAAAMRPFLQAIWTGLAAFFLVPAVTRGRRTGPALFGLGAAVVLHALYDAFLPGVTALLSVLVATDSVGAFLLARRSAEEEPALSPPAS
jgi:RsiW-degrading membrane proteinase PrsW (M82 family)